MNKWLKISFTGVGLLACGASLVSCGVVSGTAKALTGDTKGKKNQYDINDGGGSSSGSFNELRNFNKTVTLGELPPEEDIVWAPEDPDVPIAELEGLVIDDDNPIDDWFVDYKKALQKSRQEGKPMLIWFTSTRNSPFCKVLSDELFSKDEFDEWSAENVIRLRVDSTIKGKTDADRIEKRKYIEDLKKRYKVFGHPVVLILSPRGTEFGKYRGYKRGNVDVYFGGLQNAVRSAQRDYASWKSELEGKGYRVWHNTEGKGVFAKVSRYSDGKIWLIEPDGRKTSTTVNRLSLDDKVYIESKIEESRQRNKR